MPAAGKRDPKQERADSGLIGQRGQINKILAKSMMHDGCTHIENMSGDGQRGSMMDGNSDRVAPLGRGTCYSPVRARVAMICSPFGGKSLGLSYFPIGSSVARLAQRPATMALVTGDRPEYDVYTTPACLHLHEPYIDWRQLTLCAKCIDAKEAAEYTSALLTWIVLG